MRLPLIAATLAFACVFSAGVAAPKAGASQASSSSSSSTSSPASKPVTHKKKHHASRHQPVQKAPTADRISEIQAALARGGYYQGDPSGKMDSNTVGALQKFQSANGIDSTGKLDAPTLQKLGLGSDTAGISAPKPVVPPACCSTAPTPPSSENAAPASSSAVAQNSQASSVAPDAKPAAH